METRAGGDFALTIEGVLYPFVVAKDPQTGQKQWNDGLVPMLAPQVRTTDFGYAHVSPEIEVVEPFESWEEGAGFDLASGSKNRYNYSRGIDLSWEDCAHVALERRALLESDGSAIAAAPVLFFYTSLGLFMLAGAYIYEFDLSSLAWVQRDDATGTFSGAAYVQMAELDGVLYASRGASADYKYSTDGVTWTAFTDADENADVFANRGNGSDIAALWKVNDNLIKVSTSGINSGVAWSGADEVGHTSEETRGAVVVDNDIIVTKDRGIYLYDGTNTQDLWKTDFVTAANGKNPFLGPNRKVYVPYGTDLLEFDPLGDTTLMPIYPAPGMDSTELLGTVTAVSGDNQRLYIALKNRAGNTYIMKGRNSPRFGRWVWHTVTYLGANDCNALYVAPAGIMHATNPAIVLGYGTAAHYILLPRAGLTPANDPLVTFETAEGVMYGSYRDGGAKTFPKFLNRGALLGYGLSGGRYATLKYEIDRSGSEVTELSATSEGLTAANEANEVSFNIIRDIVYMATGDESATPHLDGWLFGTTPNPPRRGLWQPVVVLSDNGEFREGAGTEASVPSASTVRRVLFGAVTKRMTLADRDDLDHIVRLLDIRPVALKDISHGAVEEETSAYQLVLAEINALTSDEQIGVYDESSYDSGHVYG